MGVSNVCVAAKAYSLANCRMNKRVHWVNLYAGWCTVPSNQTIVAAKEDMEATQKPVRPLEIPAGLVSDEFLNPLLSSPTIL